MKKASILFCAFISFAFNVDAQIEVNTSYVNNVKYHDKDHTLSGKANLSLSKVSANVPVSKYVSDDYKTVRSWSCFVSGSYLNVNSFSGDAFPTERVMNIYTGVAHYRTINDRWSMMFYGGGGICQDDSRFSELRSSDIMGFAIATGIYKVNKNLQLGGGLIFSNAFNGMLVVPTVFVKWKAGEKYYVKLETRTYDFKGEAGIEVNDNLNVSLHSVYDRIGTPIDVEGGIDQYFSYNYFMTGVKADFKLTKKLTVPVEVGVSAAGTATYKNRRLKDMLKDSNESFSMDASPYCSIGMKYAL